MECPACGRPLESAHNICGFCGLRLPVASDTNQSDQAKSVISDIPITSSVHALLVSSAMEYLRWMLLPALFSLVIVYLGVNELGQTVSDASLSTLGIFYLAAGLALLFALSLQSRTVLRDLRESEFRRVVGIVKYKGFAGIGGKVSHRLLVNGQSVDLAELDREGLAERLQRLRWGRVDYTKHTHIAIEVWNDQGYLIYRHPRYQP